MSSENTILPPTIPLIFCNNFRERNYFLPGSELSHVRNCPSAPKGVMLPGGVTLKSLTFSKSVGQRSELHCGFLICLNQHPLLPGHIAPYNSPINMKQMYCKQNDTWENTP
jgi:hypothetical protein